MLARDGPRLAPVEEWLIGLMNSSPYVAYVEMGGYTRFHSIRFYYVPITNLL